MTTPSRKSKRVLRPSSQPDFDPFWFYIRTIGADQMDGIVPELIMPNGDETWTWAKGMWKGQKVKWREGWRSCWHTILSEFAPAMEARSFGRQSRKHPNGFLSPELMRAYQPTSGKEWLGQVDDDRITKKFRQPLYDHGVGHWSIINEIFGWALNCTLDYCRYRMAWGQWSKVRRGHFEDMADTFFFDRPRSQLGCKFLVAWFVRFAAARRQFHVTIEAKIRQPAHSQVRSSNTAKKIVENQRGRPRGLKMGPHADEDLWLILIWPIALHHGWTYKDVVRSLRLHFGYDCHRRPAPTPSKKRQAQWMEDWFWYSASHPQFWAPVWMTEATAKALEGFAEALNPTPPKIPPPLPRVIL